MHGRLERCVVTRDLNARKMREVRCHKGSECTEDESGAVSQGV